MSWSDFYKKDNPVAAALMSKTGFDKKEQVQVRLEFLRMLTWLQLNPTKLSMVCTYFDTYLRLEDKEEQQLQQTLLKEYPQKEEAKLEMARKMLAKGSMSIEDICALTELTQEEILQQ